MSGFNSHYGFVLGAGVVCKNRDKQLTFIVRVMLRLCVLSHLLGTKAHIVL